MILPIVAYGDPILKQRAAETNKDHPGLSELIDNMFETMYNARGVGLAAPQIGKSLRIFVIDAAPFAEDEEEDLRELSDFKKVFINPVILQEEGKEWAFNEGCLSIPGIREDVNRKPELVIEYYDENFEKHKESYNGVAARIIQHEYDHIEGILFTDKVGAFKRRLLRGKLNDISRGEVDVEYRMRFPLKKVK